MDKGIADKNLRVDRMSGTLEVVNRQCVYHVWSSGNQLRLNLVYNKSLYHNADIEAFLKTVEDSLLQRFPA